MPPASTQRACGAAQLPSAWTGSIVRPPLPPSAAAAQPTHSRSTAAWLCRCTMSLALAGTNRSSEVRDLADCLWGGVGGLPRLPGRRGGAGGARDPPRALGAAPAGPGVTVLRRRTRAKRRTAVSSVGRLSCSKCCATRWLHSAYTCRPPDCKDTEGERAMRGGRLMECCAARLPGEQQMSSVPAVLCKQGEKRWGGWHLRTRVSGAGGQGRPSGGVRSSSAGSCSVQHDTQGTRPMARGVAGQHFRSETGGRAVRRLQGSAVSGRAMQGCLGHAPWPWLARGASQPAAAVPCPCPSCPLPSLCCARLLRSTIEIGDQRAWLPRNWPLALDLHSCTRWRALPSLSKRPSPRCRRDR